MSKTQQSKNGSSRAVIIEIIMFFTYAFFAVNWIAGSTLTPEIMNHFGLTEFASATFISNAITIAKIIGNFLAASLLNKLLPKKAIGLASFLTFTGSLLAVFAPAYRVFILGRFIMGFGGALFVVYFSPVVVNYFSPDKRPTVNAINNVAYNTGSIIALLIVGPVIAWLNTWQASMGFFATISGVLFVLWHFLGEDFELNSNAGKIDQQSYTTKDALKEKVNWLLPLTYSGLLTLYIVLLNMFPLTKTAAIGGKTLSTLMAVGGVIGSVIAIGLSKVYSKRKPVIIICGILMTAFGAIMLKTTSPSLAIVTALLIGIFMFLPVTSLVMIPVELPGMTPNKVTVVMGVFWAIAYIIETIVYYILGFVVDAKGYSTAIWIALIFSLTFFIGGLLLPETGKD